MEIMGILNVTPDSFSDGGQFTEMDKIVARAKEMVADGATIIDVGGESTRPGATLVSEAEEIARVIPIVKRLSQEIGVPISIDTYKAEVARQAVLAGASYINDIGGAKFDPLMPKAMAESGAKIILMHNRSVQTVNRGELTRYHDVIEDVKRELQESIDLVLAAGALKENIIVDPGVGFAKDFEANVQVMKHVDRFLELGYPVLLGVSRKGAIGQMVGGLDVNNRLEGTLAVTCLAAMKGVSIVRVHDVLENARAVRAIAYLR